ncbi:DNA methyltransferase [Limosilactobacillus mucosae]|uniref:Site-specific DNA-methyltransferase n=1 Tax=Limosilactobacillus mucosae TaxID=97478 RepID=A0AAJ1HPR3_LIMMU|nr:site-specific DNA-methyltransferase [Limosilactobacillus mucosae]MDC2828443.1 site-specific DNA-methyltransferase [Limosilactobacillus mucosae]MDC2834341.1 site-specific DNA-methyltransferase [Limosilactobacillus mucosae]
MSVEPKVFDHVRAVLNSFDDKYLNNGKLKRTRIIEDLDAYDEALMTALLSDPLIHQTYTKEIAGVEIFEVNQFIQMLEFKDYWEDSYTKYSNKIGLTAGGKFIDESEDVVLDFPFKDTVLKAGMSKEDLDKGETADEPFLNEVIAKPEIDEMLEPKIFVNAKKYDKDGVHDANGIDDNDNLIIKGNNLIALYSLKERYAGKVKLITLDPPYNTDHDFEYNDHFTHATWLTFMKNRIEISKELLSDDGSIWVILDNNEIYYAKILLDSIMGRENFVSDVVWVNNKQSKGYGNEISLHHNLILIYRKTQQFNINLLPRTDKDNINYKNPDNDPNGAWRPSDVRNSLWRPNLQYDIIAPNGTVIKHPENGWRFSKETFEKELAAGKIKFSEDNKRVIRKIYLSDQKGRVVESVWNTEDVGSTREANGEIKTLFGNKAFATPKPERLLQRIITIGSEEGDLVLDFFMGSATTQAVAMKMHRRFIGIEQMDYINTVSVPRLQKVIEGEQGGISKDVDWQGGGSFIYAELMKKNGGFVRDVEKAANATELLAVFDRMKNTADFDFRVDLDKFEAELNTFESLADQKRELLRILDKNQLYYNYGNIDDANVRGLIADHDYQFNQSFYGNGGED